jgi:hypothetical protein
MGLASAPAGKYYLFGWTWKDMIRDGGMWYAIRSPSAKDMFS